MKVSKRVLYIIVIFLFLIFFANIQIGAVSSPDIILDDNMAAYVGTWGGLSSVVSGYYGIGYRYHSSGTGTNTATWNPVIPEAGTWEVFAMWSSLGNRAKDAPYTITYSGGSTTVDVNQEVAGGTWISLGAYSFDAGATTIVLSDDADDYVIADAIKLEYREPSTFIPEVWSAYNYTILHLQDKYYAINSYGIIEYNGEDAYTVIQSAINATSLTYYDSSVTMLLGTGYYDLKNNSLLLPNHFHIKGVGAQGTVITSNGTPIIKQMWNNFTYSVWISKMYLNGENKATNGILWEAENATLTQGEMYEYMLKVSDVMIRDTSECSVYLKTGLGPHTICLFDNVRTMGKWYIERIFDSMFTNIYCSSAEFCKIVTNHFENWYLGGASSPQLRIYGDTEAWPNSGNMFMNIRVDNPSGIALSVEDYSCYNQFIGCHFANLNQDKMDNEHSCVVFQNMTNHNIISGSFLGSYRTTSPRFKYLIEEKDQTFGNRYTGNNYHPESYGTSILSTSHPSNSNFEGRFEQYLATVTSPLSSTNAKYCSAIGLYSSSYTEHIRTIYWQRNGTITNFWFKTSLAPGINTDYTAYIRLNEATDYLPVTVSNNQYQNRTYETMKINAGDIITIKCIPHNNPTSSMAWFSFDFYPNPEEIIH